MCGGVVGAATINGPQGEFKATQDGTYNLLESRGSTNNLQVTGTFDNKELRNVKMTLGGGMGTPGDMIEFSSDGTLTVNGKVVTGEFTTPLGVKISQNGDQVVIKTPDGDSFKMYTTDCVPRAINMEGEISPQRAQGEVSGLVGTFDDEIPPGTFPEGMGGNRNGDANSKAFWDSWAMKLVAKTGEDDAKRLAEAHAAGEAAATKGAEAKAAGEKGPATTTTEGPDGKPTTGPAPTTGGPTATPGATPAATPVATGGGLTTAK